MGNRHPRHLASAASALTALTACAAACGYLLFSASGGKLPPEQSAASAPGGGAAVSAASGSGPFLKVMDRSLVLVSPAAKLPGWYKPDLVTALGVEMDASVKEPYTAMHDAAAEDGVSLWISSGYRSDDRQSELFQREVALYQKTYSARSAAEAYAARSVARPGYSEHATGLALDLNGVLDNFDQTPAFRWLDENAQQYGFILRYPKDKQQITQIKYEPWHYRFVGVKNAVAMKVSGQCLEEYLQSRQKTAAAN